MRQQVVISERQYYVAANIAAASLPFGVMSYLFTGAAIVFLPPMPLLTIATLPFVIVGVGLLAALVALWGFRRMRVRALLVKAILGFLLPAGYVCVCLLILLNR